MAHEHLNHPRYKLAALQLYKFLFVFRRRWRSDFIVLLLLNHFRVGSNQPVTGHKTSTTHSNFSYS